MLQARKFVAALSRSIQVLADAGVLKGQEATHNPLLFDGHAREPEAHWRNKRVVVSGRILTGRDIVNARQLAQELVAGLPGPR
jgi:putative intracellular protease/amidase